MHDEPFRCRTHEIERVTSYKRECGFGRGCEDVGVMGRDDLYPIHLVTEQAPGRLNLDLVVAMDVFQLAEESVPMSGDRAIAGFPGKCGTDDMSSAKTQDSRRRPLRDCDGKAKPRNVEPSEDIAYFDGRLRLASFSLRLHLNLSIQGRFRRGLIESCVEQSEADVCERDDPGDEQGVSNCTKPPWCLPTDNDFQGCTAFASGDNRTAVGAKYPVLVRTDKRPRPGTLAFTFIVRYVPSRFLLVGA